MEKNVSQHEKRKNEILEKCYDCYAEEGFGNVGIKGLAKACGFSSANLYSYFTDLDDLIIQATEYCMGKVEDDFMSLAPRGLDDLERFIDEIPYWTAEKHGKRYRLMYQIYSNPKYREHGKNFSKELRNGIPIIPTDWQKSSACRRTYFVL